MKRLKHSKNTMAEGIKVLLTLGMTVIGMGCFQILFFPHIWAVDPWFVVAFFGIEAIVCVGLLYYAFINIRKHELFLCFVDDELIECVCPVDGCGDSFRLQLDEIVQIERHDGGESYRWYLHDSHGHRHWLTSNYNNPDDKFVQRILAFKPDIPQTET